SMLSGIEITFDFDVEPAARWPLTPLFSSTSILVVSVSLFWMGRRNDPPTFEVGFGVALTIFLNAPGTSTDRSGAFAPTAGSSPKAGRANASEAADVPRITDNTTREGTPRLTLFLGLLIIFLLRGYLPYVRRGHTDRDSHPSWGQDLRDAFVARLGVYQPATSHLRVGKHMTRPSPR